MAEVRVGIIGAGGIARAVHIPRLKKVPEVKVVAVADVVEDRAKRVAEEFDIPHVFRDYEDLVGMDEVDAVVICTPNAFHAPSTLAALRAGKHVLCEKPPAMNAKEAEEMARTAREAGKVLMYAFQMRFRPDLRLIKRAIEEGQLGEVYYGRAIYLRRSGAPGGWFTQKRLSGGGPLIDVGVHVLDAVWWLMGSPKPTAVSGMVYQKIAPRKVKLGGWRAANLVEGREKEVVYDVEDFAVALVRFDNGASLLLETSWILHLKNSQVSFDIFGTEGGAHSPPLEIYKDWNDVELDITPRLPEADAYQEEINHFIECIREGKEPIPNAEQGVTIMRIIDAIYESSERGEEVRLD